MVVLLKWWSLTSTVHALNGLTSDLVGSNLLVLNLLLKGSSRTNNNYFPLFLGSFGFVSGRRKIDRRRQWSSRTADTTSCWLLACRFCPKSTRLFTMFLLFLTLYCELLLITIWLRICDSWRCISWNYCCSCHRSFVGKEYQLSTWLGQVGTRTHGSSCYCFRWRWLRREVVVKRSLHLYFQFLLLLCSSTWIWFETFAWLVLLVFLWKSIVMQLCVKSSLFFQIIKLRVLLRSIRRTLIFSNELLSVKRIRLRDWYLVLLLILTRIHSNL